MPTLLAMTASPRGDYSVSNALTHSFVESWKSAHAGGTVVTRDLIASKLPFVDLPWIAGAYTPAEQHSPEMAAALKISNELIDELLAADHIVIGTPMYNLSTPAVLKAWLDQVIRINRTFTSEYKGLVFGKKVTIVIAAGGSYAPGSPFAAYNMENSYLQLALGFIGITDVSFLMNDGTAGIDMGKTTRQDYLAEHTAAVEQAAKA